MIGAFAAAAPQDVTDVREQKRFTAGHEDFANAKLGCFASDPLYTPEAKLPPRCSGDERTQQ